MGIPISWIQVILGVLLIVPKEQAKSDALRLVLFLWILFGIGTTLVAAMSLGVWSAILPTLMVGGGIAALLFEGMEGRKVVLPAATAVSGIALAIVLA